MGVVYTKVKQYFSKHDEAISDPSYDKIQATGVIDLGIMDEGAKARLIQEYATRHFNGLRPDRIAHMGDTMGDSGGILGIAKAGGIGIAFNYNDALKKFLEDSIGNQSILGKIYFIDSKSESSDLRKVKQILINNR